MEDEEWIYMANLSPKKTGFNVVIWSESQGVTRNKNNKVPRFIIEGRQYYISLSLENKPQIIKQFGEIKQSDKKDIQTAIDYVVRNLDLFLKHYNDTTDDFDDEDLFTSLRERGEYK